ncbi:RNA polymerase sigma factor [Desulfobacula toluolica]|uniref:RNA polymerase sigma factor n=1 Tax=Desulfobacula toluolica (strain DSM 7467 / Tol2) TaxID=651182 RepID=K0NKB5_DESTT|nr:sigma-70 family RNA polymerase sigma factor [Desulfobacula toluolica]CCK79232.1 RpoE: RNA polymerase sigma-E factor (sigma24) [Desulfobacula toluolica Tol2]
MNKPKATADNTDEQDLVKRLKKGQPWAFEVLVNTYQDRLLKIAYGITLDHEESLEIVQDVFISVFKNIRTFRQDAGLVTWLRKITINQSLNWKRKWKRRFRWHHDSIESENDKDLFMENKKSNDPETQFEKKQFEENLMKAIRKLPEKIRLVFVLNVFEGLSYEQIAKTINIKKGTVSSRIHFARKSLIKTLESNK